MGIKEIYDSSVGLLCSLIATPSPSREEDATAGIIAEYLTEAGVVEVNRKGNNIWSYNRYFEPGRPTILLNSHHDTVHPSTAYTRDPYSPEISGGKLYGLGSTDAGASAAVLTNIFLHYYDRTDLAYNLCLALTAEEEISGANGIESILPDLGRPSFAVVGEPTGMNLAVAEKGLMVLDCTVRGRSGHAALEEGVNAIYKAMDDIAWFRDYRFPVVSELTGPVKMSVTVIEAGTQHNVVPAECCFTVDVRVNDKYTNQQVLDVVTKNVSCEVRPRSVRLKPSSIPTDHPFVRAGIEAGRQTFGSPTMSDQALLDIPSVKIGIGESSRSHSADEFVCLDEIKEGIEIYLAIFDKILKPETK